MSRFTLAFGIHNHQPVGNFDHVFAEAHTKAYTPFLQLVQRFPQLRFSLHQSGILWRWQLQNTPSYFDLVRQSIASGQIELMTGGFFEPILISIPSHDARGQIALLTRFLTEQFGVQPRGAWLTERIWEPQLPSILAGADVSYVPVDDTHFLYAGFEQSQLTGPFITEDSGLPVTLLPIQKRLRYLLPFGTIDELFDELKQQADKNPDGVAIYADDGEKFGVWPNTWQHCYGDGWLERFAEAIERNSDWLTMQPLSAAANRPAVGRAYLPSASYEEMLHWALPTTAWIEFDQFTHWLADQRKKEKFGRFVRGGHWRGFLAKYEEVNLMHKRMLAVSAKIAARTSSADQSTIELATEHLYAAQCNCPYWHGVFGGLYLPHIRQAIYEQLLTAESMLEPAGPAAVRIEQRDLDLDGHDDIIVQTPHISAIISPRWGGRLTSLASMTHQFELTDTLTRRHEGYHEQVARAVTARQQSSTSSIHDQILTKEEGLENYLVRDWYLKRSFIDHLLHHETTPAQFMSARFGEEGDFVLEPYEQTREPHTVRLTRTGHHWRNGGEVGIRISKTFQFKPSAEEITVRYDISAPHSASDLCFAVENNFNFQAGHADDRFVAIDGERAHQPWLDSEAQHTACRSIGLLDDYRKLGIGLITDQPAELWRMPIFTVSQSEGGFEKVYQGTTLVHLFRFQATATPKQIEFRIVIGRPAALLPMLRDFAGQPLTR